MISTSTTARITSSCGSSGRAPAPRTTRRSSWCACGSGLASGERAGGRGRAPSVLLSAQPLRTSHSPSDALESAFSHGGTRLMGLMHEVDYRVLGDDMQYVEIELDPQEAAIAEAGGMMYMDDGIEMETIFGDGSAQSQGSGLLGALLGAGKRVL